MILYWWCTSSGVSIKAGGQTRSRTASDWSSTTQSAGTYAGPPWTSLFFWPIGNSFFITLSTNRIRPHVNLSILMAIRNGFIFLPQPIICSHASFLPDPTSPDQLELFLYSLTTNHMQPCSSPTWPCIFWPIGTVSFYHTANPKQPYFPPPWPYISWPRETVPFFSHNQSFAAILS